LGASSATPRGLESRKSEGDCYEALFEINGWAISQFVLAKLVPVVGVHPFPLHELMLLSAAICRLRPAQAFEWGTHTGKSARVFNECAAHYGIAQGDGLDTSWGSSGRQPAPLFFIDGDHAHESVLRELSAIASEICRGELPAA